MSNLKITSQTPQEIEEITTQALQAKTTLEENQTYLQSLTPEQQKALQNFALRVIQQKISANKALFKDIIDAGIGAIPVPVIFDLFQIILTLHLLYTLFKNNALDKKTIAITTTLTAVDVATGIPPVAGDIGDFILFTNRIIQYYFDKELEKARHECIIQHNIDPKIIEIISTSINSAQKILSTEKS